MAIFFITLLALTAGVSWLASFGSRALAVRLGAVDRPTGGRKIHAQVTPLLGGLGIGVVLIGTLLFGLAFGWFPSTDVRPSQITGFIAALVILLVTGFLDDRYGLRPSVRLAAWTVASLAVIATGTGIIQVTRLTGHGGFSLVWWQWQWTVAGHALQLSLPSDVLTLVWLLAVTSATKVMDGLDGLVTGQTVIGAGLIAALALGHAYFQPPVALLAGIVAAAFLGFLPHNLNPAKQFLGEAGSTIAGFSLGFLAIVSGAKVATALMALGVPLADVFLVMLGRVLRGVSVFRGDDTHLHHKLLQAGLSPRQVVGVLWLIALVFGAAAFGLQSRGKILLLAALAGLTVLLSVMASVIRRSRAKPA